MRSMGATEIKKFSPFYRLNFSYFDERSHNILRIAGQSVVRSAATPCGLTTQDAVYSILYAKNTSPFPLHFPFCFDRIILATQVNIIAQTRLRFLLLVKMQALFWHPRLGQC